MGFWARWRAFFDSLDAKRKAELEEARHREYKKDSAREEFDEYGRPKRRVILTGIELPLFGLVFGGFILGFGAAFGWLFARYLLSLVAQLP